MTKFAIGFVLLLVLTPSALAEEPAAKRPEAPKVPIDAEARAEWMGELIGKIREGEPTTRRAALTMLVKHDKQGDTLHALIALLTENSLTTDATIDLARVLGIEGLVDAVEPLLALLPSADASVRGNVAVTLEYIGLYTAVDGLKKQLGKEKTGSVRNHLCRALGRCGAGQRPVRSALLKQLNKAKTDQDFVGPLLGLAYFEKDPTVARKIEKLLAKAVIPKGTSLLAGRRRARVMGWLLGEVADAKTPRFIRKKLLPRLKSNRGLSVVGIGGGEQEFYEAVARKIDGDPSAKAKVDTAIGSLANLDVTSGDIRTLGSVAGTGISTMDEMRKGRDMSKFQPKGDRTSLASRIRRAAK